MVIIRRLLFIMSIVILSSNAFAEKCTSENSKRFSFTPDVGFGNEYKKSLGNNFKKHGVCIVEKSQGHPTRLGQQSLRFEVKPGDCGYSDFQGKILHSDCKKDRERHELSGRRHNDGEYWYSWSIFLPDDFINIFPTKLAMGQFHQADESGGHVVWMLQNSGGGYHIDNQVNGYTRYEMEVLESKDMIGKWNDIIINSKWTHLKDGYFRLWVNGKLLLNHSGPTKTKGRKVYHKFGIYRSFMKRFKKYNNTDKVPGQVVYFDEVRTSKSCNKLKLKELGYNCQDLSASIN